MWGRMIVTLTLAFAVLSAPMANGASPRPLGDSRVVAHVPFGPGDPGFPEGIVLEGQTAFVSTPAQFAHRGDAKVYAFSLVDGGQLGAFPVHPPDPAMDNGYAGMAADGSGRLYVAGQQGVIRLDPATGVQSRYAALPDLPPCAPVPVVPCSPTASDRPPFPNDIAFDAAGHAYVTDSFQATIWRVPPGPGAPEIWCQNAALDGAVFGPNGIRPHPNGAELTVTVTGPPGAVYALRRPAGSPACQLRLLHTYPSELPDGLAFGRSGRLYVTLAGSNQVSMLAPDGSEQRRFSGPAADTPQPVPWDAPASVAIDNRTASLMVVNHALFTGSADPRRFVIFDVFVDDRPFPLERPVVP